MEDSKWNTGRTRGDGQDREGRTTKMKEFDDRSKRAENDSREGGGDWESERLKRDGPKWNEWGD